MKQLSVVLATRDEEENIGQCLDLIKDIADEIIVVDEYSKDKTTEIAKKYKAKIYQFKPEHNFHETKQKALEKAEGKWILQLDADERVTPELAREINKVIYLNREEISKHQEGLNRKDLFMRHQKLLERRDGAIGTESGQFSAFFVPRLNYFLGKYLKYGGVYPDGVIRLVRNGKARFPAKSVHEQIEIDGKVGWLENDLLHISDPTFRRYLRRNNHYIDLLASDLKKEKKAKNIVGFLTFFLIKPVWWFLLTQVRHKGILDGWRGIIFSIFSALRFPRAYWRYIIRK